MAYCRLNELKGYLGQAATETTDDVLLEAFIGRATVAIDNYTGRTFEAATETRYFESSALDPDGYTLWMDRDLLTISTGGLLNGDSSATAIASTDYWLVDRNAGPPYYGIRLKSDVTTQWEWDTDGWVAVTGTWGWSTTPPVDITHACIRLAAYYYHQKDTPVYETTAFPESGLISVPTGMPRDVELLLEPYKVRLSLSRPWRRFTQRSRI